MCKSFIYLSFYRFIVKQGTGIHVRVYKDVDGVSDTLGWFIINRQNESSREDQYMSDVVMKD